MQSPLTDRRQRFLRELFPGDGCVLAPEEAHVFGADASRLFAAPWAAVRPSGVDQVRELLAWAQSEGVPIFPRARATNVVGACVPQGGGVVVSSLRLNRILEVSGDDFLAVAEPGVVTGEFQAEVAKKGLFYPPDPASVRFSTLGGNVSTCAGGMRAVKYGVTRDYVLGLEAVLPGGKVIRTGGRTHKNVVGLDLTRLLVGSEGTLAFLTRITAKLLPLPEASATVLAGFDTLEAALAAAGNVFRSGMLPTAMELMCEEVIAAVSQLGPVPWPDTARAILILRLDGSRASVEADLAVAGRAMDGAGVLLTGSTPGEEEALWEPRRLINPALFRLAPDKIADDVTVPRGRVREAVEGYQSIGRNHKVRIMTFGHLGDGNIHVNIMYDKADGAEAARARAAKEQVLALTLKLQGTLSGEHGVGLLKRPYVPGQLGPTERMLMAGIKRVFDPKGIMNPGKGF